MWNTFLFFLYRPYAGSFAVSGAPAWGGEADCSRAPAADVRAGAAAAAQTADSRQTEHADTAVAALAAAVPQLGETEPGRNVIITQRPAPPAPVERGEVRFQVLGETNVLFSQGEIWYMENLL